MKANILNVFIVASVFAVVVRSEKYLPILLWHSAGESWNGKEMNEYSSFLKSQLENEVYVKSVALANDPSQDLLKSLTIHPFHQIKTVCAQIQADPKFWNGYNAIGLSQGGLFLRGLAQTCPFPPMQNLISLGAPQQGVHQFPRCEQKLGTLCVAFQSVMSSFGYFSFLQKLVAPATYWHDTNEEVYRQKSTFLAVINNEFQYNANYVMNLHNLRRMILVKYAGDLAIVPNESTWLGYYNKDGKEFPMEETEVYRQDKLGLQALRDSGRLIRLLGPGDHLELDENWFVHQIVPFLKEIS